MRAVIQRVSEATVAVDGQVVGAIGQGLVVLLGVTLTDTVQDVSYLAEKIANLRIFEDEDGKMNRSVQEVAGEILSISQFTLYGDCSKGRRPSFTEAAKPEVAQTLYDAFNKALAIYGLKVAKGQFQAHMMVSLVNDGPVTMILDSPNKSGGKI